MAVEWACLLDQRPVAVTGDDLTLAGGKKGHVLLFHGLTGSPAELAYVAHYLHNRIGYSVWCPRLVNHGQPLGVLARTRWQEFEAFARACFKRALSDARAAELPLFIGGLSLGAILALLIAAECPENVDGTICLAPTLFYDGWNVPWTHKLIPIVSYTPLKYFTYFREEPPYGLKDESLRERMAKEFSRASLRESGAVASIGYAHFPVRLFCEMRPLFAKCMRSLHRVVCPVLLIQAEHDDATGPENSEFIYRNISSKHKEIILLHNSYHLVTVDLERESVAAGIAQFCRSVNSVGARLEPERPLSGSAP